MDWGGGRGAGGVQLLAPILKGGATSGLGAAPPNQQLLYDAGVAAWELTFHPPATKLMPGCGGHFPPSPPSPPPATPPPHPPPGSSPCRRTTGHQTALAAPAAPRASVSDCPTPA